MINILCQGRMLIFKQVTRGHNHRSGSDESFMDSFRHRDGAMLLLKHRNEAGDPAARNLGIDRFVRRQLVSVGSFTC